ncbi:hypothetical protein ACFPES_26340 [Paenibacillus sp. GCM10023248]|nr:hypothetical protein [Paenibacillus sp. MAHUQ-63]
MFVWLSIHVLAGLPNKLPLVFNVLLYMLLSIVDINKLTFMSDVWDLFLISNEVPAHLSVIGYRDFTFSLTLLAYANVFFTAVKPLTKLGISLYTFLFLYLSASALRWTGAITDLSWNGFYETACLAIMMLLTYGFSRLLLRLMRKEMSP